MYVVQRTDTGEYFRQLSSDYLKNWAADDPRRENWTSILELAKTYTLKGAISVATNHRHDHGVQVVMLKVIVDVVVKTWKQGMYTLNDVLLKRELDEIEH